MKNTTTKLNGYDLSRRWFDFAFENPHLIKPVHVAIYFFAIEHCNRLGWKHIFGFPTSMAMEAIGLRSYSSYKKHFDDLVEFGFIEVHEYSRNQHTANIIALTLNVKAHGKATTKALDKALSMHESKQRQSTVSIDKQVNKETSKQLNNIDSMLVRKQKFAQSLTPFISVYGESLLKEFEAYWTEPNKSGTKFRQELEKTWDTKRRLDTWVKNDFSRKGKSFEKKHAESKLENNINVFKSALESYN